MAEAGETLTNVEPATLCHSLSKFGSGHGLNAVLQLPPAGSLLAEDVDELNLKETLQTLELGGVDTMRENLDWLLDLLIGKTVTGGL